ncbi:MAG: metal-dependent hydrolase [Candidatus Methanomethylicaceae archaeon]
MGARIDRATHYLFGIALYTLLANLLSEKIPIIVSPMQLYNIVKEVFLNKTIGSFGINLSLFVLWFIVSLFSILSMRIAVIPDSIDKPKDEYENHRKFGHSLLFILLCSIVSYFAIYLITCFFLSMLAYYPKFNEAISFLSSAFGLNLSFLIFTSLLSHLLLDIITYSGVPLFYPISKRYFSIGIMKSGSPIMLLILFASFSYIFFYSFLPITYSFLEMIKWRT